VQALERGFQLRQGVFFRQVFHHHHKLIATQPGDKIGLAQQALQPLCQFLQQQVASLVSPGIVDRLEVVQINHAHRHQLIPALGARQRCGQMAGERKAVGQAGQPVVMRGVDDQRFAVLAFGNVLTGADGAQGNALLIAADHLAGAAYPQPGSHRVAVAEFFLKACLLAAEHRHAGLVDALVIVRMQGGQHAGGPDFAMAG
jgi:hypothetical protein